MSNKKLLMVALLIAPTMSFAQLKMGCPFDLSTLAELQSPNNDTVVFGVAKNNWTLAHLNEYYEKGIKCISTSNLPETIKNSQIRELEKDSLRFKEVIERNAYQNQISDRRRESERLINKEGLDFVKIDREGFINSFSYRGISRSCDNINKRIHAVYPDVYENAKKFENICVHQKKDTQRNQSLDKDYTFAKANVNATFKVYEDLTKMATINPVEMDKQALEAMHTLIGNAKAIRDKYFDHFDYDNQIKLDFSRYDRSLSTVINIYNKRVKEDAQVLQREQVASEYKAKKENDARQCDNFLADKIPEKLKLNGSAIFLEGHPIFTHDFFCGSLAKKGIAFKFSGNSDLTLKNKKDDVLKLKYVFERFPGDVHKNEKNIAGYIMGFTHIYLNGKYLPIQTIEDQRFVANVLANLINGE